VCEVVWLHKLLTDLLDHEMDPMMITRVVCKSLENLVFHDGSKHVEIKYHYFRDMMERKIVHLQYLPTHEQIADIFTKLAW
jgi:hypothetical protein